MAAKHGKSGWLSYGAAAARKGIYRITSWSLNINSDQADVTSFTTNGGPIWRSFDAGLNSWDGSISGFWDEISDSSGQAVILTSLLTPATGSLKLAYDDSGGGHFSGGVYWKSGSFGASVDAENPVGYSFQGNGVLTYSTTG
jgi:predicted secreted protein